MTIGTGPGELCASITIQQSDDTALPGGHGIRLAAVVVAGTTYDFLLDQKYWGDLAQLNVDVTQRCGTGVNFRLAVNSGVNPPDGALRVTVIDPLTGNPAAGVESLQVNIWRVGRLGG